MTDSTGKYLFRGFPSGSYLVAAVTDTLNFVTQFYKNADFSQNASSVSVDNSIVSGVSFTLRTVGF
jgi:hypothetical protein